MKKERRQAQLRLLQGRSKPLMEALIQAQINNEQKDGESREDTEKRIRGEIAMRCKEIKDEYLAVRKKQKEEGKAQKAMRARKAVALVIFVAILAITIWGMCGCFNPDLSSVFHRCSEDDQQCAPGQSCDVDLGICQHAGSEAGTKKDDLGSQDLQEPSKCTAGRTEIKLDSIASVCVGAFSSPAESCTGAPCTALTSAQAAQCDQSVNAAISGVSGSFNTNINAAGCGDMTGAIKIRFGCGKSLRASSSCAGMARAVVCKFPEPSVGCESGGPAGAVLCCR